MANGLKFEYEQPSSGGPEAMGFPFFHEKGGTVGVLNMRTGLTTDFSSTSYQAIADTFRTRMMMERNSLESLGCYRYL